MKRLISRIILFTMILEICIQPFGGMVDVLAVEKAKIETEKRLENCLDYSIFSGSKKSDLAINSALVNVNESIHTNSNFKGSGAELTVLEEVKTVKKFINGFGSTKVGKVTENAQEIEMRDLSQTIKDKIKEEAQIYDKDTTLDKNGVGINKPILVNGKLTVNGSNIVANDVIYSTGDMTLNTSLTVNGQDEKLIFCSENGDININTSDTTIKGVFYAPNGKVNIAGAKLSLEGRIIADEVAFNGSILNVNSSEDDFDAINSEPVVEAGKSVEIYENESYELKGIATDDGLLFENLDITWEQLTGPGEVVFENSKDLNTKASFSEIGEYELELTAFDGRYEISDTVIVNVKKDDRLTLEVKGNLKENRLVLLDFTKSSVKENIDVEILPIGSGLTTEDIKENLNNENELIKEFIFKKAGEYKILASVDGITKVEKVIDIKIDEAPNANFNITENVVYRASDRKANINLNDASSSPDKDKIGKRIWKVKYDSDNDGDFEDEDFEIISEKNEAEVNFKTERVGKYKAYLEVVEIFTDTLPEFITDEDYRRGDTTNKIEKEITFEVTNKKPKANMKVEKAKKADIVVTLEKADTEKVKAVSESIKKLEKDLKEKGVDTKVSTIDTSSITAEDDFAWTAYDHEYYDQRYGPTYPKHILIEDKNIKMLGYTEVAFKDFLYIEDTSKLQKTFTFDMKRDQNDWHTLEGGGFLFNTKIDEENNTIEGYCILITQSGLKLIKINKSNLTSFRNGTYENIERYGKLLKTFRLDNVMGNHKIKIVVDDKSISLWDNGKLVIDKFILPEVSTAFGFGPITSHISHWCPQESYFTFNNIVMESVSGQSLEDALAKQKWTEGAERFLINLSDEKVESLNNAKSVSNIASIILKEDLNFIGLGNEENKVQYDSLIKAYSNEGLYFDNTDIVTAMQKSTENINKKILEKDYNIETYVAKDEPVEYVNHYEDIENDSMHEAKWKYKHNPEVYVENDGPIENNDEYVSSAIESFNKVGNYGINLKVRDNPVGDNEALDEYRLWSDEVGTKNDITVHRRPFADFTVDLKKENANNETCKVAVSEEAYDLDHKDKENKGIVEREYYWKNIKDDKWTEGKFPERLAFNEDFIFMFKVKDEEGFYNKPTVKVVSTKGIIPGPGELNVDIVVKKETVNFGDEVEVKLETTKDMEIKSLTLSVEGKKVELDENNSYKFTPNKIGEIKLEATVEDKKGNKNTEVLEISVVDNEAPKGKIEVIEGSGFVGEELTFKVTATDNVEVKSIEVKVNGKVVTLNEDNTFKHKIESTDKIKVELKITDTSGLVASGSLEITPQIKDEAPIVELVIDNGIVGVSEDLEIKIIAKDDIGIKDIKAYVNEGEQEVVDNKFIFNQDKVGDYNLKVVVTDTGGNEVTVTGVIKVVEKNLGIELELEKVVFKYGETVDLKINVPTNVQLKSLVLKVDGQEVKFDENNSYKFKAEKLGITKLEIIAEDKQGVQNTLTQEIAIVDDVLPEGQIEVNNENPAVGDQLIIKVSATDNIGVKSTQLKVNGTIVEVDKNNTYKHNVSSTDKIFIEYRIEDVGGNAVRYTLELTPKNESAHPIVEVTMAKDVLEVGEALEIGVKVTDDNGLKETKVFVNDIEKKLTDNKFTFKEDKVGIYELKVVATDVSGNITTYTKQIKVVDEKVLEFNFNFNKNTVKLGEDIVLQVELINEDILKEVYANIDGKKVPLTKGEDGLYTHTIKTTTQGTFKVEVVTVDKKGNELKKEKSYNVVKEIKKPEISLKGFGELTVITEPTDIIGTVKDDDLIKYTLEISPHDKKTYKVIGEGTKEVIDGKLGTLDPTMMQNGLYDIRLTATDASGYKVELTDTYQIAGDMKVGNFTLGFDDINIPVNGLPMTVLRNYDSRDKVSNDFGIGWSLNLNNIKIQLTTDLATGWVQEKAGSGLGTRYEIFETKKHRVVITYPNGEVDEFRVKLDPQVQKLAPIRVTALEFEALQGTKSELKVVGDNECNVVGGTMGGIGEISLNDSSMIDPINPQKFELKTKDGTKYIIDLKNGVEKITYINDDYVTINKNGITHSSGKKVTFERDAANGNRINSITDFAGNKLSYKYSKNGDLAEVIDPKGNSTKFTYNSDHGLIEIINANGTRVTRNEYDDSGRLIAHVDADGNRTEYNFDKTNKQYIVKDRLGNLEIYNYDSKGNIVSYTDKENHTTKYTYDENDNLKTEIDPLGNKYLYEYDVKDNLLSKTDPYNNKVVGTYNNFGEVLTIKDLNGNVLTNTYDARGQLTEIKDPLGNSKKLEYSSDGLISKLTDEIGQVVKYTYDKDGRPKTMVDQAGQVTNFVYDKNGNCTSKSMEVTTAEGKKLVTVSYVYDKANNLTSSTDSNGNIISYEYDNINNLVAEVDKENNRITYEYDVFGNVTKIKYPNNITESFTYDKEGNNLTSTDGNGKVTTYKYDKMGRMTQMKYPNGLVVDYVYDAKGQVIEVKDSAGSKVVYGYDKVGRNTSVTNALNQKTEFVYGKDHNIIKVIDAKKNTTEYGYDKLGRRDKVTLNGKISMSYEYDKLGRVIKETNLNGKVTSYGYDALGNLSKVTDPLNNVTSYKYNEVGNLVEELDANGHSTKYAYDELGRVKKRTLHLGQSETYSYDKNGNIISKTDFNGSTTKFEYNANGLLTKEILDDKSEIVYEYDNNGLVTKVKDSNGTTSYTYDDVQNLTSQTNPNGEKIDYTYDLKGNIKSIKTKAKETTYTYDKLDRLKDVTDSEGVKTVYAYDEVGNLKTTTLSNGTQTVYEYDDLYRLIKLINKKDNGDIISSYDYTVDNIGFRTQVVENTGKKINYTYDDGGKLLGEAVTEKDKTSLTTYTYDKVGNRLTKVEGDKTTKYVYDANNRLVSEDGIKYTYDNNGNLIKKDSKVETINYEYNSSEKLSKVTKKSGDKTDVESYKYNAAGTRIQKTTNGVEVNYLVDENTAYHRVLEEKDNKGSLIANYTYGHDLISQNRKDSVSLYYKDGLGSTRALANLKGEVTDTYHYDAFGNITSKTGTTENSYLFAGEQLDNTTGQYYLRARYMDPSTGRFTTMDSYLGRIQDPTSLHKYLYAHSNPVNYTDPSGYTTLTEIMTAMGIKIPQGMNYSYQIILLHQKLGTTVVGRIVIEMGQEAIELSLEGEITLEGIGFSFVEVIIGATTNDETNLSQLNKNKRISSKTQRWLDAEAKLKKSGAGDIALTIDKNTGYEVGTIFVDPKGNAMISPSAGGINPNGTGYRGMDMETLYPNGSVYQRNNPNGHASMPGQNHGHGHLLGTGPGKRGAGSSIDLEGKIVPFYSPDAHWPTK